MISLRWSLPTLRDLGKRGLEICLCIFVSHKLGFNYAIGLEICKKKGVTCCLISALLTSGWNGFYSDEKVINLFEENESRGGVCGHVYPSFMVFGFKLDVSRLLNRVDKIVLCNRFCFFLIHMLLGCFFLVCRCYFLVE